MSPKRTENWVSRGILSACDCFSCSNKIAHRFKDTKISILCREPCNYRPLKGAERPVVDKLTDIEQLV